MNDRHDQNPLRPPGRSALQVVERVREAAQAIQVKLSRQQWYAVLTASRGAPLP